MCASALDAPLRLLWLALVFLGCASPTRSPQEPSLKIIEMSAGLRSEFTDVGNHLAALTVTGRVKGEPCRFVIDSGATRHLLSRRFSQAVHLPPGKRHVGHDLANAEIEVAELAPFDLEIGELKRQLSGVVSAVFPPQVEEADICGLLSPQHLLEKGYVLIDFQAKRFVGMDGTHAQSWEWLAKRYPGKQIIDLSRRQGSVNGNLYVSVALANLREVTGMLDTGHAFTEFTTEYLGQRGEASEMQALGISGATVRATVVPSQTVVFAGRRFGPLQVRAREVIANKGGAPVDALIGLDLLQHFALVLPQNPSEDVSFIALDETPRTTGPATKQTP